MELAGNLDKGDPVAKRELGYLANLLEERALFLNAEANTSNVDPFGKIETRAGVDYCSSSYACIVRSTCWRACKASRIEEILERENSTLAHSVCRLRQLFPKTGRGTPLFSAYAQNMTPG